MNYLRDLDKSKAFYTSFGWTGNPLFTDENAAAITVSDTIHIMLLTHEHYAQFTDKPIADAHATSAGMNAISTENPDEIDAIVDKAVAAGAVEGTPQELGFMRSRAFSDPDGHHWEVMWMDPIAAGGDWEAVQKKYPQEAR
ncbi:VOC family protein [Spelaeicoccus albus]|uniref:VOC domain-containing protein n=1 Tax=Spelaeicoccus albus TaxID=1280376 RepID=A0A7Z0A8K3_9MICO|nr:VOC family protein [Spelaeicoccus albus]NYI66412.1 hypothetical protein [Spelaeicoccus albus]